MTARIGKGKKIKAEKRIVLVLCPKCHRPIGVMANGQLARHKAAIGFPCFGRLTVLRPRHELAVEGAASYHPVEGRATDTNKKVRHAK